MHHTLAQHLRAFLRSYRLVANAVFAEVTEVPPFAKRLSLRLPLRLAANMTTSGARERMEISLRVAVYTPVWSLKLPALEEEPSVYGMVFSATRPKPSASFQSCAFKLAFYQTVPKRPVCPSMLAPHAGPYHTPA